MIGLKDLDSKHMTSNKAMQAAADAVILVRNGKASIEELSEVVVALSVIIVTAVETIDALEKALTLKKVINIMDVEGHEVPGNGVIN